MAGHRAEQLGAAFGVGIGIFVAWLAIIWCLSRELPTKGVFRKIVDFFLKIVGFPLKIVPIKIVDFLRKNFFLWSQEVEASRRKEALRAFLLRAFKRHLNKPRCVQEAAGAKPLPKELQVPDNALNTVAVALDAYGIITKEHLLQLSDHDGILDRVLADLPLAIAQELVGQDPDVQEHLSFAFEAQPAAGPDAPCQEHGLNEQQRKSIKTLAQALVIEASRPLPRTHDPQVLLRGVNTLITLNVFLASAVFIGLSLAAPDDMQATLQTAYCDLTQQLVQVTANITGRSPIFTRASNWSAADTRAWQGAFQRRSELFSCPESGRTFPDPSPWLNGCTGDEKMKPELMAQQIIAFALFLGSTGVAFGLLLSVQPEGELNEGWERWATWFPYICFSGVATLLGLVFLLWSLITMGEVQYGPWENWYGCGVPWLKCLAVGFITFEVACTLIGTAGFFNGWKVV